MDKSSIYVMVDMLASEYSYTVEYIMALPTDVIFELQKKIIERKKMEQAVTTKLMGAAISCALSGKLDKLDGLFKKDSGEEPEEPSPEVQKAQMLKLWIDMGRDPKVFEEQYKNGDVRY